MKAIILGNKRGIRRLAGNDSLPKELSRVGKKGNRALDWILQALKKFGIDKVIYVGGYHIEKVIQNYPSLKFYYHEGWQKENDLQTLMKAHEEFNEDLLVINSNIIFRHEALKSLLEPLPIVPTIATLQCCSTEESGFQDFPTLKIKNDSVVSFFDNQSFDQDNGKTDYFSGLTYFPKIYSKRIPQLLDGILQKNQTPGLIDLLENMLASKQEINIRPVTNHLSSLTQSFALAKFVMGTKAQTLERLRPLVAQGVILPIYKFTWKQWEQSKTSIINKIQAKFSDKLLAVRSSSIHEDSWESSNAGGFHSELKVDSTNQHAINKAIDSVFNSYEVAGHFNHKNEVLVQENLTSIHCSGVLFTRDLKHKSPYYIINYDQNSTETDTVTSGTGEDIETQIIYRNYKGKISQEWMDLLVKSSKEIERLLDFDGQDIEFAFDKKNKLYILQVRPLVFKNTQETITNEDFEAEIQNLKQFIIARSSPQSNILGKDTLFSDMTDWNPGEMIGTAPTPLALSLYQKLITNFAWAEARAQMGLRDITSVPLLYSFAGRPFIDVRASFNSFIPLEMKQDLATKLVETSINYLKKRPELHDKVEFDVMITCHDGNFDGHCDRLVELGFSKSEINQIESCYLNWTNRTVLNFPKVLKSQLERLQELEKRREKVSLQADQTCPYTIPIHLFSLTEDCIKLGTIPFSILARFGFMAVSFLKSIVKKGGLSIEEYDYFLKNVPTVSTEFNEDIQALYQGSFSEESFKTKYGHLRPSCYDISSSNYAEMFDQGAFTHNPSEYSDQGPVDFEGDLEVAESIWQKNKEKIQKILNQEGLAFNPDQLFNFIVEGIRGREFGKFEFTKNLNLILEGITAFGEHFNISRANLSFIPIENFLRLATDLPSSVQKIELEHAINYQKKRYTLTQSIILPSLITSTESIENFSLIKSRPNFITTKKIEGEIIDLNENKSEVDLTNKIVLIKSADPGHDWIFSKSILGLITQYGGCASHMAIRAAEFGLPAAIGCGEMLFNKVKSSRAITLNCGNQTIQCHK